MKYKNFDTDYNNSISFSLSNFNNVNILSYLKKEEEEEKNGEEIKVNEEEEEKEEEDNIFNPFSQKFEKKDEEKKGEEIKINEEEEEKEEEEDIFNPFLQKFEKKEEEKNEIIEKNKNEIIDKKINYIQSKNIDNFNFPHDKKVNNKIIYKYMPKNIQNLKEKMSNNYFLTINSHNIFPFLKTKENKKHILELERIPFNEELKDLKQNYISDILLNFIVLLNTNNNFNNSENPLTINDYTFIVISYIKNLENKIIDIKK